MRCPHCDYDLELSALEDLHMQVYLAMVEEMGCIEDVVKETEEALEQFTVARDDLIRRVMDFFYFTKNPR